MKNIIRLLIAFIFAGFIFSGCGNGYESVKIGLLMHAFDNERWEKDRNYFISKVNELGGEVEVYNAGNDALKQLEQANKLLDAGIKVLVVVPVDQYAAGEIVKAAHEKGGKVISYDRLIRDCNLDYYVSTDNVEIGELQARYLTAIKPKGKYALIGGAVNDNNSHALYLGQRNVLQPLVEKGDIEIVFNVLQNKWDENEGYKNTLELFEKNSDVDAIIAGNDEIARGVIRAIKETGKQNEILVAGMDADLPNIQMIIKGEQTCTIFKPYEKMATAAADIAVKMARDQEFESTYKTVSNGKKLVPSILYSGLIVNKENVKYTVIEEGYQEEEDVYK
jgi:D-xylose transport system substrate-binding protein